MEFNEYQEKAVSTAVYGAGNFIIYPTLGLCGEAGEVAEKVKKIYRDNDGKFTKEHRFAIKKELGDVLWYIANLANDLGITLQDVASTNINKLEDRKKRDKIHGNGDER